jgi:hypothetical protein
MAIWSYCPMGHDGDRLFLLKFEMMIYFSKMNKKEIKKNKNEMDKVYSSSRSIKFHD